MTELLYMTDENVFPLRQSAAFDRETFACACLLGIILGAVYDTIRAVRRGARLGRAAENLSDFFYTLFFFFCYFILSAARTGELRLFTLAAMLAGAAAERFTLGRLLMLVFSHISRLFRRLYDRTLGRAIAKIIQIIKSRFVKSKSKLRKFQKNRKKVLKV